MDSFRSRDVGGNKGGNRRQRFSAIEVGAIIQRLTDYCTGDEDKIISPFNNPKSRFLGVIFGSNWILKD
jgi:hypothetical protein